MKGQILLVGIGPGSLEHLTDRAQQALKQADVIIGYKLYVELIRDLIGAQEVIASGMRQETERAQLALQLAEAGKTVALISSGDAGVYGMAGLVLALVEQAHATFEVEVIPGITSVLATAASLGAPLMHDFVVISLSDLLTPWEKIVKRLHAAGQGDFVVGLYNPRSTKRQSQIVEAQQILLHYRSPQTPVGIVWNVTRAEERVQVTTLDQIPFEEIDMFATVIIGNSESYISRDKMITPRGYEKEGSEQ